MRKLAISFFVLLIFVGATGVLLVQSRQRPMRPNCLSVTFTGREPGLPYRAAGFYLTNTGRASICLQKARVQVAGNSGWKAMSEGPVQVSPILDPGRTNINFSPIIDGGDYRKIVVEWPEDRPWRIEVVYAQEAKGLDGIITKCNIALRTLRTSHLLRRIWVGSYPVISTEISK